MTHPSSHSFADMSRSLAQELQTHLAFSKTFQNTVSLETPLSEKDTFGPSDIPTFIVDKEVAVLFFFYLKHQTKFCFNFFTDLCVVD